MSRLCFAVIRASQSTLQMSSCEICEVLQGTFRKQFTNALWPVHMFWEYWSINACMIMLTQNYRLWTGWCKTKRLDTTKAYNIPAIGFTLHLQLCWYNAISYFRLLKWLAIPRILVTFKLGWMSSQSTIVLGMRKIIQTGRMVKKYGLKWLF